MSLAEDVHVADGAMLHEIEEKGVDFATHGLCRTLGAGTVQAQASDIYCLHEMGDVGDRCVS